MSRLKIKITKENIVSLIALLPYLEGGFTNFLFYHEFNKNTYFRPILGWLIVLILLCFILTFVYHKQIGKRFYNFDMLLLTAISMISIFYTDDWLVSINTWMWVALPMVLAILLMRICRHINIDFSKVLVGMIFWFCLFAAVTLSYQIIIYGVFINSDIRMEARAGGSVIFGYTSAVYFALCLCEKEKMSKTSYYVALLILTLVAFATGSRGAVWPIVMLWILQFLFSEITVRKILISIPLICFVVFLSQFDISTIMFSTVGSMGEAFSRLLRSQSTQRTDTILSIVQLFSNANISDIIFGRGIGGFFPYQNWILSGGNPDRNVYTLYGLRFLVQPHNSFLYMLVECGVVSLIVFIHVFIASILKFVKSGNKNYIFKVLFVLVIMVTNFLDSIFFVQPGVALVFWLLLLMLYEQNVAEAKDKKV